MDLYHEWIAFQTVLYKEVGRILRIWTQTILPPAITTTLYFIIFGHVIGPRVGTMDGVEYIKFIAPGLMMMAMITSAYSSTVSGFFSIKFQRSIEELLVSPMRNSSIVLGFVLGGVVRGLMVGFIVMVIALFFTRLHVQSLLIILSVGLLATLIFSLAGFINAVFAKKFDDVAIIPTFVLTPLTYLGGVFYSINLLPKGWQIASYFNPIVYIVNAFRYGFLGIHEEFLRASFLIMIIFVIVLFSFSLYLMNAGVGLRD